MVIALSSPVAPLIAKPDVANTEKPATRATVVTHKALPTERKA